MPTRTYRPLKAHHLRRLAAALVMLASGCAQATDAVLLEVLRTNKLITEAQYQALLAAQKPAPAQSLPVPMADQDVLDVLLANGLISREQFAALRIKTGQEKRNDPEAKAALRDGIRLKSQDNTFQTQVGAYFQVDGAVYDDDRTDFSSGTELRRARLALSGVMFTDWDYRLELDFAGTTQGGNVNTVTVTDAFVRYRGFEHVQLTAGNFKVPFGLEAVGSAKYATFIERGLPFAFLTLRRLGGMVSSNGDNWTASIGAFGDSVTSQNNDDEGQQYAARFTYAPWYSGDYVLHFGASGSYVNPSKNGTGNLRESVQFRAKPESNIISDALLARTATNAARQTFGVSSGRLVDTGTIPGDVRHLFLSGAEVAAVYGPFSIQAEYIRSDLKRDTGGALNFSGYYGYGSWFLTGETRAYRGDRGVFDMVTPKRPFSLNLGGWGAWELGARFSSLELNDRNIAGGEIDDVTVGLNWYPNSYLRFMANYVNVLDVTGGAHNDDEPDLFEMRMQLAY